MENLGRRGYLLILRLHPAAFRHEFAREMALDFEASLQSYGLAHLLADAIRSLIRQWFSDLGSVEPAPIPLTQHSLLAGRYVIVYDRSVTSFELGLGLVAAVSQVVLCSLALSRSPEHLYRLPSVHAATSATEREVPSGEVLNRMPSDGSAAGPTFERMQARQLTPELFLFHPPGPLPSFEVATIKLIDPNTADGLVKLPPGGSLNPLSVRRYIMNAYGAVDVSQVIGGPDWLNKDSYQINGKLPDDLDLELQKMSRDRHLDQTRMLEQSLLSTRFHLKVHFETRVLPVFELLPARGGLKITEVPAPPAESLAGPGMRVQPGDPVPPGTMITTPKSNGTRVLNGRAIKMQLMMRVVADEVGSRPIVDHSGFRGYFNVTDLTWAPLASGASFTGDPEALSLTGALQAKLGLRLVSTKDPIEVLVIDGIDRPTPN